MPTISSTPATLFFGGSFNPIHHGHLIGARAVAEVAGFERIALVPSAEPPHKKTSGHGKPDRSHMAEFADRLSMCQLAVAGDPFFEVTDIERRRDGPSYTIETARQLRPMGHDPVHWLIGGDTVPHLPTWHEPLALLEEVHFVIMARPGCQIAWDAMPPPYRKLRDQVIPAPLIDISATQIRHRVAGGLPIHYLTAPAVERYIRERRMYGSP